MSQGRLAASPEPSNALRSMVDRNVTVDVSHKNPAPKPESLKTEPTQGPRRPRLSSCPMQLSNSVRSHHRPQDPGPETTATAASPQPKTLKFHPVSAQEAKTGEKPTLTPSSLPGKAGQVSLRQRLLPTSAALF